MVPPPATTTKRRNVIALNPNEFEFTIDDSPTVNSLARATLENLTSEFVAFKFKTNAPKSFAVKPVFGVLQPEGSAEVVVRCSERIQNGDGFLIQYLPIAEEEQVAVTSEWWRSLTKSRFSTLVVDCKMVSPSVKAGTKVDAELQSRLGKVDRKLDHIKAQELKSGSSVSLLVLILALVAIALTFIVIPVPYLEEYREIALRAIRPHLQKLQEFQQQQ